MGLILNELKSRREIDIAERFAPADKPIDTWANVTIEERRMKQQTINFFMIRRFCLIQV